MLIFKGGVYSHIECNVCGAEAPPAEEMREAGGLARMGWYVAGGNHRCPEHHDTPSRPSEPVYR